MRSKLLQNIITITLSILVTFITTSLILLLVGKNPLEIFSIIFFEVFTSGYGLGQTLFKATPLIFLGVGLSFCFHASLFNIGAEGQLNAGTFTMALAAYYFSPLPVIINIIFSLLVGFIVSASLGLIPAIIKIRKGVSEVITTIMLNFIVLALINYLLINFFAVKETVRTEKLPEALMLPKFSDLYNYFDGSSFNYSFIFAIIVAVVSYFVIYKTKFGYKVRAIGYNETASKFMLIKVNRYSLITFLIGAGITSLVGLNFVFGYKGYYEFGFSNNIGFTAIAVALLAKNNPIGVIFSALLFGLLDFGGLAINTIVPKEIMFVIQGIVILSIISIDKIVNFYFEKV
ncbi:MAG: ABC transporter permease [Ignavibacteria bacterium]|nr:ABC transporter permease [Ignavibacteria bacterium]